MPDFDQPIIISAPYGHPDDISVYINEVEYVGTVYVKVPKKINQLESFELKIMDVTSSDTNVAYGKIVKIFTEQTLLLKGKIEEVTYTTDGFANVKGYGMGILLAKKEEPLRTLWGESTVNLTNYFLSLNSNSTAPWIIEPDVVQDFGEDILFRSSFDDKLQIMDALARQLEWDWWVSNGDAPYNDDRFNIFNWRGSLAPTYSVNLSGTSQNGLISSKNDNVNKLINSLIYLGKGDGATQIQTKFAFPSTVYDKLDQTIKTTSDMVVLVTAAGFPNLGIALIGRTPFAWSAKTANFFNTMSWDTQGTTLNTYHYKGVLATLIYNGTGQPDTTLNGAINDAVTTITVASTGGFSSTGSIIIGTEVISYTGTSATQFTGCGRGTSNTTANAHDNGMIVFQYSSTVHYTDSNPQTGSAIALNGLRQTTIVDPTVDDERQAEMIASNWFLRNATLTNEITFEMMDYFDFLNKTNLGDRIQIIDSDAGLNDNYRFIGLDFTWDMGNITCLISASNKKITETSFMDSIGNINRLIQTRLTYSPT